MTVKLYQPDSSPVVTTIFDGIVELNIPIVNQNLFKRGTPLPTSVVMGFGRTYATVNTTLKLSNSGGSSPYSKFKAMYDRFRSHGAEAVKLEFDFGSGEIVTAIGLIEKLTPGIKSASGLTVWTVALTLAARQVNFA